MASKTLLPILLLLLLLFLIPQLSSADTPTLPNPAPSPICRSTPYPFDCNSISNNSSSNNVYDYTRFSFRKSLSSAQKFLSLISNYLRKYSASLTLPAVRALQDCQFLAQCNVDYLLDAMASVNRTSQTLPSYQADTIQSLLSAIITNTQTCIDGIQTAAPSWSNKNGVISPLSNDTRLFSVTLALFTRGFVPKGRNGGPRDLKRKHLKLRNGQLNLRTSPKNQGIYHAINNHTHHHHGHRKLLQISDGSDQVVVNDIVIVSQDPTFANLANFTTIMDAVNAAPNNTNGSSYFLIYVTAGVYQEYVNIPKNKKYIMMIGDGINQTVITGNRNVVDGWTTFNSATFVVGATGFVAVNITFQNTAGAIKHQAVAVRNSGDLTSFYSCSFEGYQDTLYIHTLRQFYEECDIYGTVDFVFGDAAAVFQKCNFYPRLPMSGQFNAITAQGRSDPNQNTGISIQNCTIRAADDLASSNRTVNTYLGRPWKLYSRTVYMQSYMGSLIHPSGWNIWSGDFALNTSYYAEFNNWGPGSDTSQRVTWPGFHIINATEAAQFTLSAFIAGDRWVNQTGVPYMANL